IWHAQEAGRARKREAAARLPFPHAAPRPIQEKIVDAVGRAVRQGENLLAQAPTGTGKTAAALYPAMVESLTAGRHVVFLTAKTLQQTMAVQSLAGMHDRAATTLQTHANAQTSAN